MQHVLLQMSLVDLSQCRSDEIKHCDYCDFEQKTTEASHRCLECQDNLCDTCVEAHRRTKVTRAHKLAPISDMQQGVYDSDVRAYQLIPCDVHKDEVIRYYCGRCEKLICRECKVSLHENHHCSDLKYVCDTYKKKAKLLTENIKHNVPNIEAFLKFLQEYVAQIESKQLELVQDITKQADILHQLVDEYKNRMINEVNKSCTKEKNTANRKKASSESLLQTLQGVTNYTDVILDHGKAEEILSIREIMMARLTELAHSSIEPLSTKLNINFSPGNPTDTNLEIIFGQVKVDNTSLHKQPVTLNGKNNEVTMLTKSPTFALSVELINAFECRGLSDPKDIWPTGISILSDDRIVIMDRENRRVKLFDKDGQYLREFGQDELGCPYDVAILKNGNIAVTDYDEEDVKIYTPDGSILAKLKGPMRYPRGITVDNNGHIIIVDAHSHRLVVHEHTKGKVVKIIEGKDEDDTNLFNDPYYVTTNKKGYIIITDWVAPNVKILTPDGRYVNKYGSYGIRKDQCLQPYGVCTDSEDYIYVADNQNHRIHMLNPDGKFIKFVVSRQHGLWHPMALAMNSEGHLVVTEALGKVKTFRIK